MPKLPRSANASRTGGKPRGRSGNGKAGGGQGGRARKGERYDRRPVDAANGNGAVATAIELNEFETGLLSDLFAVVEEHAGDASVKIDRAPIERAFVFA